MLRVMKEVLVPATAMLAVSAAPEICMHGEAARAADFSLTELHKNVAFKLQFDRFQGADAEIFASGSRLVRASHEFVSCPQSLT